MIEKIKRALNSKGIDRIGVININDCEIINQRIMPEWAKSAIIFCIPYRSSITPAVDGFSEYARIYDYHNFSQELYNCISNISVDDNNLFKGFCDHSPINEKLAAAKCGLGVIGRNSLFIDEKYGSFIFLGSIITNVNHLEPPNEVRICIDCGLCVNSCPNSAIISKGIDINKCLSAISQRKNKTNKEKELLKQYNIVWGCDICQNVCPHNINSKISPMEIFKDSRIPHIDKNFILSLSNDEFKKYAFSYKGKQIVLNNIEFK